MALGDAVWALRGAPRPPPPGQSAVFLADLLPALGACHALYQGQLLRPGELPFWGRAWGSCCPARSLLGIQVRPPPPRPHPRQQPVGPHLLPVPAERLRCRLQEASAVGRRLRPGQRGSVGAPLAAPADTAHQHSAGCSARPPPGPGASDGPRQELLSPHRACGRGSPPSGRATTSSSPTCGSKTVPKRLRDRTARPGPPRSIGAFPGGVCLVGEEPGGWVPNLRDPVTSSPGPLWGPWVGVFQGLRATGDKGGQSRSARRPRSSWARNGSLRAHSHPTSVIGTTSATQRPRWAGAPRAPCPGSSDGPRRQGAVPGDALPRDLPGRGCWHLLSAGV